MKNKILIFVKKYWAILLTILGALIGGFAMAKSGEKRRKRKALKKSIKETEKEIENIGRVKEALDLERNQVTKKIKDSKNESNKTKQKIKNINNQNKDVAKATDHLKKIGKKGK